MDPPPGRDVRNSSDHISMVREGCHTEGPDSRCRRVGTAGKFHKRCSSTSKWVENTRVSIGLVKQRGCQSADECHD
jgi:hypothetical protein